MTIREKICEAGVSTLREYLCLSVGGGEVVIYSDIKKITSKGVTEIKQISTISTIKRKDVVKISRVSETTAIIVRKRGLVDVVC